MEAATKELISGTDYGGGVREEKRYESTTGCEEGWKKETTTIFEVHGASGSSFFPCFLEVILYIVIS